MAKTKVKPHGTPTFSKNRTQYKNFEAKTNENTISTNQKRQFNSGKVTKNKNVNKKVKRNQVDVNEVSNKMAGNKTFDKKQWRLKKYSKKYKLDKWQEKRKKAMLTEYYKQLKDDEQNTKKFDVKKIYEQYDVDSDEERKTNPKVNYVSNPNFIPQYASKVVNEEQEENVHPNKKVAKKKLSAYQRAQAEYQRIQDEKVQKREEFLRQKAEREEALNKYKKNKIEKYKKLSKKTRKGQPVMKDRMEMLLEKIQSTSV